MNKIRFSQKRSLFFIELKNEVIKYLEGQSSGKYANKFFALKSAFCLLLVISSYGVIITCNQYLSHIVLLLLAIVYGCSCLLLAINVAHDAVHNTIFKKKIYNKILYRLIFIPLGINGYLWHMRHTKSHHLFPNVNGSDIDIDENPLLRLSPNHQRCSFQRYQHLYAPFAYSIVVLHIIFIQDFQYLIKKELANMRGIRHSKIEYILFFIEKLVYFAIIVAAFIAVGLPLWQCIIGYIIMTSVVSFIFVLLLVGTHFSTFSEFPSVDDQGNLPGCWASHALNTSLDWSPNSRIASFISGGVNTHAAHHLFPGVCHIHYSEIIKIIDKITTKYNVKYNKTGFKSMVKSHFIFLYNMSKD